MPIQVAEETLSEEWILIFVNYVQKETTPKLIVENILPVFVPKKSQANRVKLSPRLLPYKIATQLNKQSDGKYEVKLSKNHKKIFVQMIKYLNNMEGESWNEKWKNVGKPLKSENLSSKNKLQEGKEASSKSPNIKQTKI